jgi:hypothetical protein
VAAPIRAWIYPPALGAGNELTHSSNRQWTDEYNGTGTGQLRIPATSPNLAHVDYDCVVTMQYEGEDAFSWIVENIRRMPVGEAGERFVELSGRGCLAWLEDAPVLPNGGVQPKSKDVRYFSFASLDAGDHDLGISWTVPVGIKWDLRDGPAAGLPLDWPDIDAYWIWSSDPTEDRPDGEVNWFRYEFTTSEDFNTRLFCTADNGADVYIDGEQVLSFYAESGAWKETHSVEVTLPAGYHVVAIKGTNSSFPVTTNAASVILSMVSLTPEGDPDALLVHTDELWQCSDTEPQWLAGDILYTLIDEAVTLGIGPGLANLTIGFDGELDSNGDPWTLRMPPKDWPIVTTNLLAVALDLAEVGLDVWVSPDDLVLHVTESRGQVRSVALTDDDTVTGWVVDGKRATATEAYVRTDAGWVHVEDTAAVAAHGRRVIGLEAGNTDSATTAESIAQTAFHQGAQPEEVVSETRLNPAPGKLAYQDYFVADTVTGLDAFGDPAPCRILALTVVEVDDAGKVEYQPELEVLPGDAS